MNVETLADWKFLLRDLEHLTGNAFHDDRYIFRGQREADWKLVTSFDRFYSGSLKNRNSQFSEMLENFRERAKGNHFDGLSDGDLISIAQHYGLPTRVLDWSYSPYVALFFAVSGAVVEGSGKSAALWIMDQQSIANCVDEAELKFLKYEEQTDLRIKNQKGLFSRLLIDETDLGDFLVSRSCGTNITKLIIPPNCLGPLARHLKSMDITFSRLFPGLEGHTKEIVYDRLI